MSEKERIESSDTPMAEAVRDKRESESASVGGKLETSEKEAATSKVSLVVGDRVFVFEVGREDGSGVGRDEGCGLGT